MGKAEATVEELVGRIERGQLRLPEMQRRYVWRSPRVRDLLDSLYRGYPSGAILLWETNEDVPLQEFGVPQKDNPYQNTQLLLDGQQRLTSLSAVIRGEPVMVRGRKKPLELLFNLEHPEHLAVVTEVNEEADDDDESPDDEDTDSSDDELQERFNKMVFVVATKKLEQLPQWVRVTDVFKSTSDSDFLKQAGVTSFDDPRYDKYSKRLARLRGIRGYVYRIDVLERSLSYDEVTEIFVRVNSLGAKLRSSDLALAQITAKWPGALKTFQGVQEQSKKAGFDVDLGLHLRNLVAFATNQSRFLTIGNVPIERLQEAWKHCVPGIEYAINFLKSNAGIDSPALLSSPYLLVTLGYFGHARRYTIDQNEAAALRKWALLANAKGRYTRGSSETLLDQDLATIRDGGGVPELLERLRLQVGRLDIVQDELMGRNQRSALFKTMFLAFREAGAKDWKSNLAIALDHRGVTHKLQFHHIFPKALLRGHYTTREADDIANLAFISGKTNKQILAKPPKAYFPQYIEKAGKEAFAAQCIPTDDAFLDVADYKAFLAVRRKQISQRLNQYLGCVEEST
jgi:hypothetical protein